MKQIGNARPGLGFFDRNRIHTPPARSALAPVRLEALTFSCKLLALILALLLSGPALGREIQKPASPVPAAQALIDQAWSALEEEMGRRELDRAISFLEQANRLDPKNPEILVELAADVFHRGLQAPSGSDADQAARRVWFERGRQAADSALVLRPSAGANFWAAANCGMVHKNDNVLIQASIFPEILEKLQWIAVNDRPYFYGAHARFWTGVLTRTSPMVVKLAGMEPDQIYAELAQAIAAHPAFIENYLSEADYFHYLDRKDQAFKSLQKALSADPRAMPTQVAMNRLAQRQARETWKLWTGKDYQGP